MPTYGAWASAARAMPGHANGLRGTAVSAQTIAVWASSTGASAQAGRAAAARAGASPPERVHSSWSSSASGTQFEVERAAGDEHELRVAHRGLGPLRGGDLDRRRAQALGQAANFAAGSPPAENAHRGPAAAQRAKNCPRAWDMPRCDPMRRKGNGASGPAVYSTGLTTASSTRAGTFPGKRFA